MSEFTPADFPDHDYREPVCAKCFSDDDIAEFIENFDRSRAVCFAEATMLLRHRLMRSQTACATV